MQGLPQIV